MDILHALDQMAAFLRDFTVVARAYYQGLIDQGFSEEQALELTVNMQQTLFESTFNPNNQPPPQQF